MSPEEIIQKISVLGFGKGHAPVEPPVLMGLSGFLHTFSLLIVMNGQHRAFDFYNSVGQFEVLRTSIKIRDTQSSGYIIDMSSKVSPAALKMARDYGMSLFTAREIEEHQKTEEVHMKQLMGSYDSISHLIATAEVSDAVTHTSR